MITDQQGRTRASVIYSGMKTRARKLMKDPAYELAFTRAEFQSWLMGEVGLTLIRCPYCGRTLDILNVEIDHNIPLSRSGEFALWNMSCVCNSCNREKGDLLATEFMDLSRLKKTWHPTGANLLTKRLKDGLAQNAQRIQLWKKRKIEATRDAF